MARSYSDETKAAVMAALLTGQSISSTAKEYEIPKGTVSGWKRKALEQAQQGSGVATQKPNQIGPKIIVYLETSLDSLQSQAKLFGDPEWLRDQSADQLAVLHGVQTDKAIRLLEAINRAESQN